MVAEEKKETRKKLFYVLELSSFQLDGMFKTRINVAILTNITPDHLDSYNYKFQNYINSKFRITQNQTKEDAFIYCADDEVIAKEIKKRKLTAQLFPFSIKRKIKRGAYLITEKAPSGKDVQKKLLRAKEKMEGIASCLFAMLKKIKMGFQNFQLHTILSLVKNSLKTMLRILLN